MATYTFLASVRRDGDVFLAECPAVGTLGRGKTLEEALETLRLATELYLEEFRAPDDGRPMFTTFKVDVT